MKIWIAKESHVRPVVKTGQEFYSKPVDFDEGTVEKLLEFEGKIREYCEWLNALAHASDRRTAEDLDKIKEGAPVWLGASVDVRRKKQATDQPSSKPSLGERKRMELKSRTSQKKAE